jgi:hypothetical protein
VKGNRNKRSDVPGIGGGWRTKIKVKGRRRGGREMRGLSSCRDFWRALHAGKTRVFLEEACTLFLL